MSSLLPPKRRISDRYELGPTIGRGGMGVVWLADDLVLQRQVAVKEIAFPPALPEHEQSILRARVMREARAAARLNHPSAVTVFDVLQDDGRTYLVMEFVNAPTLTELVDRQGPLTPATTARIGLELLGALEAAHRQGIVHRDVKPANVMVSDSGRVKLADFGVAAVADDPKLTTTGLIIGSPSYMAPEQALEGESAPATDLWGLGATLYFAVEGVGPFDRPQAIPTLHAVAHDEPRTTERAGALAPVLADLLRKDPGQRPNPSAVRARLEQIVGEHEPVRTDNLDTAGPGDSRAWRAPTRRRYEPVPQPASAAEVSDSGPRVIDLDDRHWDGRRRGAVPWLLLLGIAALVGLAAFALARSRGDDPASQRAALGTSASEASGDQVTDAADGAEGQAPAEPQGGEGEGEAGGDAAAGDGDGRIATPDEAAEEPAAQAGDQAGDQAADSGGESADAGSDESAGGAGGSGPQGPDQQAIPSDWQEIGIGPPGATIWFPPDWEIRRDGTRTDLVDPAGGRYLRLDWTDSPRQDPVSDWQRQAESFRQRYPSYAEVAIEPETYRDYNAALWEYTYSAGGADLHAYNLGFVAGDYGYALNFQTHEDRWEESQGLFEQFKQTFQPAS